MCKVFKSNYRQQVFDVELKKRIGAKNVTKLNFVERHRESSFNTPNFFNKLF